MGEVWLRIAVSIVCTAFFFAATHKTLGVLQQSGYRSRAFVRWLLKKENMLYNRLVLWSGLTLLSTATVALCFSPVGERTASLVSAVPFFGFCLLYCIADSKYALKVPLKRTGRVCRLSAVYLLFTACASNILLALCAFADALIKSELYTLVAYLPMGLMPLTLPFLLAAANAVEGVFENARNKKFVKRAGQVLNETKITRVAVVGSYGKTSVKNILATLLAERYTVVKTPASYNTPVGIAKTVTGAEFAGKEVFVAEMGARRVGDIAELCRLVQPDYAIFTGVCAQHAESFGSENGAFRAKSEIFDGTKTFVLCGDGLRERVDETEKRRFVDYAARVKNLQTEATFTRFTLCLDGGEIDVRTSLLGESAAQNIALAATLAERMGLTAEEIARGAEKLEPIPHRLQLLENDGVYILDDGYNANPVGAREAIVALRRFAGKKYVVTPGLVEAGILEEKLNAELGALLVGLDGVYLVGDTLVGAVKKGYSSAGGDEEKVHIYPTLAAAQTAFSKVLQKGDCILFLNDLPDFY